MKELNFKISNSFKLGHNYMIKVYAWCSNPTFPKKKQNKLL